MFHNLIFQFFSSSFVLSGHYDAISLLWLRDTVSQTAEVKSGRSFSLDLPSSELACTYYLIGGVTLKKVIFSDHLQAVALGCL